MTLRRQRGEGKGKDENIVFHRPSGMTLMDEVKEAIEMSPFKPEAITSNSTKNVVIDAGILHDLTRYGKISPRVCLAGCSRIT